jgi:hypothetical protein
MKLTARWAALVLLIVTAFQPRLQRAEAVKADLVIRGTSFTIRGQPRFLLGISLFGALGKAPVRDQDVTALRQWGISIVRVWAHWRDAIYGPDGSLTPDGLKRLMALKTRLAASGLLLELVLLRPGQLPGQKFAIFNSAAARLHAVEELARRLKGEPDVLFDLYNEHDHPDGPISHAEARKLRDAVKAIDPSRLVTISSTEHHFLNGDGNLDAAGLKNLAEEAGTGPEAVRVDVLAPHLPRTPDWASMTGPRVKRIAAALKTSLPVYLNEENRARDGRQIPAAEYVAAARSARDARAAGWMFHTGAGFELDRRPFVEALSGPERQALDALGREMSSPR